MFIFHYLSLFDLITAPSWILSVLRNSQESIHIFFLLKDRIVYSFIPWEIQEINMTLFKTSQNVFYPQKGTAFVPQVTVSLCPQFLLLLQDCKAFQK